MGFGYAVYFTERDKNRVVRWDPDSGDVDIVAGGTKDEPDQALNSPYGLAFESSGTLLVADKLHHRICRVVNGRLVPMPLRDTEGSRTRLPDSSAGYNPTLQCPTGLFVEEEGSILCTFADDYTIYRIQRDGTLHHLLGILPNRNYLFHGVEESIPPGRAKNVPIRVPTGIVKRRDGTIYFIERRGPQVVRAYTPELGLRSLFPYSMYIDSADRSTAPDRAALLSYHPAFPSSLALDGEGVLYITEAAHGCVLKIDEKAGEVFKVINIHRPTEERGKGVAAMAFGPDGTAWILNKAEATVEAYAPSKLGLWKPLGVNLTAVKGEALSLPVAGSGLALGI